MLIKCLFLTTFQKTRVDSAIKFLYGRKFWIICMDSKFALKLPQDIINARESQKCDLVLFSVTRFLISRTPWLHLRESQDRN